MVKVKICGITNIQDAKLAAELGAWAIGFVFYEKSPRYISPEAAQKISEKMKKNGVKTIGVFVNESADNINKIGKIAQLDYVQMHGVETSATCAEIKLPYIKNVRNSNDLKEFKDAFAYLTDACDTQNWGGTGTLADWDFSKEVKKHEKPMILSGGLSLDNIQKALTEISPDYIDISSSLEMSAGVKNHELMKEFFKKIKEIKNHG